MRSLPKSVPSALFALTLMPFGVAVADEQHHQPETEAQPPAAQITMPMMTMMGQSTSGMPMMNMMGPTGMGMMGQTPLDMPMGMMGQAGADMGAHVEGRIAFLRAELAITGAQAPQWEAFARALRDSVAKLKQLQPAAAQSATGPMAFLERAELQEQWLTARLEGLKSIKAAFASLQAVLSDDQKKTAEELFIRPVCLSQMGII